MKNSFKAGVVGKPLLPVNCKLKNLMRMASVLFLLRSCGMFDGYLNPFCRREDICENGFF